MCRGMFGQPVRMTIRLSVEIVCRGGRGVPPGICSGFVNRAKVRERRLRMCFSNELVCVRASRRTAGTAVARSWTIPELGAACREAGGFRRPRGFRCGLERQVFCRSLAVRKRYPLPDSPCRQPPPPSLLHYGRRYLDNSYDDRDLCENRIAGHRCARTGRSVPRCAEYRGGRNRTLTSKTGLRDRGAWNLTEEERWASMWKSLHCPNRGLPNTVAIFRVAAVFFGAGAVSVCRCAVGFRAFLVSRLPAAHRASAGVGCRRYAKRGI